MQVTTIVLWMIALIDAVLSFIIARGERTNLNKVFSLFVLSAALWTAGIAGFIVVKNLDIALWLANAYYLFAALIPVFFVLFAHYFNHDERKGARLSMTILSPILLMLTLLILKPNLILLEITIQDWGKSASINQSFYVIYGIWFIVLVILAYFKLFNSYFAAKDEQKRRQLKVIFWGTIPPYLLGMLFNLILPWLGSYKYIWLGPIFTVMMVMAIAYAIAKHHLFNLKVLATEIFIFALWFFILIRAIIAESLNEQIIESILLAATILIGILLIRGVLKEVKTRERMETLANELGVANERLTELDRQKSEFLSIASHQLRSPLTAIKGYSSMLLEGSFGKLESKMKEAVERIFLSSERLVIIIEDFLNVSRIEQGRMQYDFASVDVAQLVDGVMKELEQNAKQAGLALTFNKKSSGPFIITADFGKIRQVVTNIVDNAIKYTPKGSITVTLDKDVDTHKILLTVTDTGIGISRETLPTLFQKFVRAKGASKISTSGTGLGLYVVKELMKAHKGSVWVDSPGEGKGSTFYLEFMAE